MIMAVLEEALMSLAIEAPTFEYPTTSGLSSDNSAKPFSSVCFTSLSAFYTSLSIR